jgi:hypothetical protein
MIRAESEQEDDRGIVRMAIVENFRSNLKDHLQAMKMLGHPVSQTSPPATGEQCADELFDQLDLETG